MSEPAPDGLARALTEAERRVTARLAGVLARRGGSIEEWRVLTALGDGPPRPMGEIAELEGVPAPTLSRIVDRLVLAGLVRRDTDARDRRRVLVGLADPGRARFRELRGLVVADQEALRSTVGAADLAELERLLRLASRRLSGVDPAAPGRDGP